MALSETIHHKFLKLLLPILCLIPRPLPATSFRFIRMSRLESFSNSSVFYLSGRTGSHMAQL